MSPSISFAGSLFFNQLVNIVVPQDLVLCSLLFSNCIHSQHYLISPHGFKCHLKLMMFTIFYSAPTSSLNSRPKYLKQYLTFQFGCQKACWFWHNSLFEFILLNVFFLYFLFQQLILVFKPRQHAWYLSFPHSMVYIIVFDSTERLFDLTSKSYLQSITFLPLPMLSNWSESKIAFYLP